MARHRIVVLLLEQVLPLHFAIPMHVFAREAAKFYEVRTANRRRPTRSSKSLDAGASLDADARHSSASQPRSQLKIR